MGTSRQRSSAAIAGHIAGLDGVRAFAVLAVVAFHLWPDRFPGGFIGVDVFFVISGFLITTLLVREGDREGHIDLPAFWLRRARRLLPALVVVVAASITAAWLVDADLLVDIDRQALGALTFSTNWIEIRAGADYFDHGAPTLFATFWSLAVEEQFYLLWPLVLVGLLSVTTSAVGRVRLAVAAAAASALWMAVLATPGANPTRVYYGTDTHLFGLVLGAALSLCFSGGVGVVAQRRWTRLRAWVGYVALAGLVALVFTIRSDATSTYRGGLVLASVLSAVVIACLPGTANAFTQLHGWRPLTWVGERSYGIYLWHWPVILIVTAALPPVAPGDPPRPVGVALSAALTLGLAAASYRWIEMPIRRHGFLGGWLPARSARPAWGAAVVVVVLAAAAVATAPDKSEAQLAVEAGERAIAEQSAAAPPSSVAADVSVWTAPPAWPADLPVPPGTAIIGLGDSVLSGAAPAMYERFPGILLDAKPIRQWRDAPGLVQASLAAGTMRPVVVLAFGTNAGLVSEESRQSLQAVLDALGPDRRVVLVNTVGVSRWVPSTNTTLAEIAAARPNTIVADWHSVVAARPELLHNDRTHPNMGGIEVYAELVATALQTLGP